MSGPFQHEGHVRCVWPVRFSELAAKWPGEDARETPNYASLRSAGDLANERAKYEETGQNGMMREVFVVNSVVETFGSGEPLLTMICPYCNGVHPDTCHARLCPRAVAHVAQHSFRTHAMFCVLERLPIVHTVEDSAPYSCAQNIREDQKDVDSPAGNPLSDRGLFLFDGLLTRDARVFTLPSSTFRYSKKVFDILGRSLSLSLSLIVMRSTSTRVFHFNLLIGRGSADKSDGESETVDT